MQHPCSCALSLALAASFAVPHAALRYRASMRLYVDFDMTVHENRISPPLVQIFYDQGGFRGGFTERKSTTVMLPERETRHIQHPLPLTRLRALRIDYLNGPGRVTLDGLVISDALGVPVMAQIPATRFGTYQTTLSGIPGINGQTLDARADKDADDPHIVLEFSPPLRAQTEGKLASSVFFGLKIWVIVAGFLEAAFFCLGKSCCNDLLSRRRNRKGQ